MEEPDRSARRPLARRARLPQFQRSARGLWARAGRGHAVRLLLQGAGQELRVHRAQDRAPASVPTASTRTTCAGWAARTNVRSPPSTGGEVRAAQIFDAVGWKLQEDSCRSSPATRSRRCPAVQKRFEPVIEALNSNNPVGSSSSLAFGQQERGTSVVVSGWKKQDATSGCGSTIRPTRTLDLLQKRNLQLIQKKAWSFPILVRAAGCSSRTRNSREASPQLTWSSTRSALTSSARPEGR